MSNSRIIQLAATSRPAFLILTPCSLFPAFAFVLVENVSINYADLVLVFIGALAAHISVNMLNEYEDFMSGLDLHTQRTAFSGGSGSLPMMPELAKSVRLWAFIALLLTLSIGCYFIAAYGWGLLPIGLPGILCAYFYTTKITHNPWLCLIVPGLAFGPLMMDGAYFVLSGHYSAAVFSTSLIVFFLVNNLLLLNQFPDLEADKNAGRRHLPILIGRKKSAWVYAGFLSMAYLLIIVNCLIGYLPSYSLAGMLTLFLAMPAAFIALKYFDDMDKLNAALGLNVAVTLLTPVLIALGLILQ